MKGDESQNMDMSAKPADTSTPNKIEFEVNGKKYWYDKVEDEMHRIWMKEQEWKALKNWAEVQKELHGDNPCWCEDGKDKRDAG